MAPLHSQKPLLTAVQKFCQELKDGTAGKGEIDIRDATLNKLTNLLRTCKEKSTLVAPNVAISIHQVLEHKTNDVCRRLGPRVYSVVLRIIQQSEYCREGERILYLLAAALHTTSTAQSGSKQESDKWKLEITQGSFHSLLEYLVCPEQPKEMRRWAGLLCLQLVESSDEIQEYVAFSPEELRRSLGARMIAESDEILKTILGQLINALARGGVAIEDLWPAKTIPEQYESFPTGPRDDAWKSRLQEYIESVWTESAEEEDYGQVYFAQLVKLSPKHIMGQAGFINEVVTYVDCFTILASATERSFDRILEVPIDLVEAVSRIIIPDSLRFIDLALELKQNKDDSCYLDSAKVQLKAVRLTVKPSSAKHIEDHLFDLRPDLKPHPRTDEDVNRTARSDLQMLMDLYPNVTGRQASNALERSDGDVNQAATLLSQDQESLSPPDIPHATSQLSLVVGVDGNGALRKNAAIAEEAHSTSQPSLNVGFDGHGSVRESAAIAENPHSTSQHSLHVDVDGNGALRRSAAIAENGHSTSQHSIHVGVDGNGALRQSTALAGDSTATILDPISQRQSELDDGGEEIVENNHADDALTSLMAQSGTSGDDRLRDDSEGNAYPGSSPATPKSPLAKKTGDHPTAVSSEPRVAEPPLNPNRKLFRKELQSKSQESRPDDEPTVEQSNRLLATEDEEYATGEIFEVPKVASPNHSGENKLPSRKGSPKKKTPPSKKQVGSAHPKIIIGKSNGSSRMDEAASAPSRDDVPSTSSSQRQMPPPPARKPAPKRNPNPSKAKAPIDLKTSVSQGNNSQKSQPSQREITSVPKSQVPDQKTSKESTSKLPKNHLKSTSQKNGKPADFDKSWEIPNDEDEEIEQVSSQVKKRSVKGSIATAKNSQKKVNQKSQNSQKHQPAPANMTSTRTTRNSQKAQQDEVDKAVGNAEREEVEKSSQSSQKGVSVKRANKLLTKVTMATKTKGKQMEAKIDVDVDMSPQGNADIGQSKGDARANNLENIDEAAAAEPYYGIDDGMNDGMRDGIDDVMDFETVSPEQSKHNLPSTQASKEPSSSAAKTTTAPKTETALKTERAPKTKTASKTNTVSKTDMTAKLSHMISDVITGIPGPDDESPLPQDHVQDDKTPAKENPAAESQAPPELQEVANGAPTSSSDPLQGPDPTSQDVADHEEVGKWARKKVVQAMDAEKKTAELSQQDIPAEDDKNTPEQISMTEKVPSGKKRKAPVDVTTPSKRQKPSPDNIINKPSPQRRSPRLAEKAEAERRKQEAPAHTPASPHRSPRLADRQKNGKRKSNGEISNEPLLDDHLRRKPNIINFYVHGPRNQGLPSATKTSPRKTATVVEKAMTPVEVVKNKSVGVVKQKHIEVPRNKRKRAAPSADEEAEGNTRPGLSKKQKSVSPTDVEVFNRNDDDINQMVQSSPTVQEVRNSSQQSRVDENGSPVAPGGRIVNHVGRLKERLSDHRHDDSVWASKYKLSSIKKARPAAPGDIAPRYIPHTKTRQGSYEALRNEDIIKPQKEMPDPFVEALKPHDTSFMERLRAGPAKQTPPKPIVLGGKSGSQSQFDDETTLVNVENETPGTGSTELTGTSAKSLRSVPSRQPLVESQRWNMAMRPHYKSLEEGIEDCAKELLIRLNGKDEALKILVQQYHEGGNKILDSMARRHCAEKDQMRVKLAAKQEEMAKSYKSATVEVSKTLTNLKQDSTAQMDKKWREQQGNIENLILQGMREGEQ